MKKFLKNFMNEFKAFALKGNVIDMAVGVIIATAFASIVTALTEDFINPLIACIPGNGNIGGAIEIGDTGNYIRYGDFITSVINFVIMALILFMILKFMNKLIALGKKKEEAAPTTKECPYCKTQINILATRCPNCTSQIDIK